MRADLAAASDQRLVEHVRAGSEPAFEALFARHHRPVLAFCARMLGSRADAEDVAQQTFVAAYRDLVTTPRPVALRPWLYAIARHRCVSVLRARRERPVAVVPEPALSYHLTADVVVREDVRAALADVAQLPEDQRAALVLAELGDLSHAEVADVLGCPREKVKALVFQARSSLETGRAARETSCAEIRHQLATARGPALRRATLRRHVRDCAGCRAFGDALRSQRPRLGLRWPLIPGLGALFGTGGGGAAVTAGGVAAAALVVAAIPVTVGGAEPAAKAERTTTTRPPAHVASTGPEPARPVQSGRPNLNAARPVHRSARPSTPRRSSRSMPTVRHAPAGRNRTIPPRPNTSPTPAEPAGRDVPVPAGHEAPAAPPRRTTPPAAQHPAGPPDGGPPRTGNDPAPQGPRNGPARPARPPTSSHGPASAPPSHSGRSGAPAGPPQPSHGHAPQSQRHPPTEPPQSSAQQPGAPSQSSGQPAYQGDGPPPVAANPGRGPESKPGQPSGPPAGQPSAPPPGKGNGPPPS
jgi:RNA polymerase sigma factor (sigma-70 family)